MAFWRWFSELPFRWDMGIHSLEGIPLDSHPTNRVANDLGYGPFNGHTGNSPCFTLPEGCSAYDAEKGAEEVERCLVNLATSGDWYFPHAPCRGYLPTFPLECGHFSTLCRWIIHTWNIWVWYENLSKIWHHHVRFPNCFPSNLPWKMELLLPRATWRLLKEV